MSLCDWRLFSVEAYLTDLVCEPMSRRRSARIAGLPAGTDEPITYLIEVTHEAAEVLPGWAYRYSVPYNTPVADVQAAAQKQLHADLLARGKQFVIHEMQIDAVDVFLCAGTTVGALRATQAEHYGCSADKITLFSRGRQLNDDDVSLAAWTHVEVKAHQ